MSTETITVKIDSEIKKRAKILAVQTGFTLREIVELLLNNTSEKEIIELSEKKGN
ncbi:MAG: hypothetical protein KDK45_00245 [Leptospiraceae bacterium]|nr:hypothetical protein [Leptospiraceae bacterium]